MKACLVYPFSESDLESWSDALKDHHRPAVSDTFARLASPDINDIDFNLRLSSLVLLFSKPVGYGDHWSGLLSIRLSLLTNRFTRVMKLLVD